MQLSEELRHAPHSLDGPQWVNLCVFSHICSFQCFSGQIQTNGFDIWANWLAKRLTAYTHSASMRHVCTSGWVFIQRQEQKFSCEIFRFQFYCLLLLALEILLLTLVLSIPTITTIIVAIKTSTAVYCYYYVVITTIITSSTLFV